MSRIYRVALGLLLAVGLAGLLILQVPTFFISPWPNAVSIALALLYAAIILAVLSRTPLWPRGWWFLSALLWGAGTCMIFVMTTGIAVSTLVEYAGSLSTSASWGGAYPEELAKALGVALILAAYPYFARPWHGLMVGMVIGLGFEAAENAQYGVTGGVMDPNSDWSGLWAMWLVRLVAGPFIHICLTGIAGWAIGWAYYAAGWHPLKRAATALAGIFLAFIIHFLWNFLPENTVVAYATMGIAATVLYPTIIYIWVKALKLARTDPGFAYVAVPRSSVRHR